MQSNAKQAVAIIVACVFGGVVVYLAMRPPGAQPEPSLFQGPRATMDRPDDESRPSESSEAVSMSHETYAAMHARVTERIGLTDAPNQSGAADAITEYAAHIADGDVDRMLALGLPVGATPDAEMVSRFRSMLPRFHRAVSQAGGSHSTIFRCSGGGSRLLDVHVGRVWR